METNLRFVELMSLKEGAAPIPKQKRRLCRRPGSPSCWVQHSSGGFTLIELLVVMVIIGLLGALVAPRLFKNVAKSKITAAKAQIANFQTALGAYRLDVGTFPSTDEGLQALRVAPLSAKNWEGPYLPKEIPLDPWGNPYIYKYPGEHGDEPDIISLGADGKEGGDGENGDIFSWK